ncbi:Porin [Beijerinckiaceae bacterium RH AL1]|nr:carbohydrate porin [Beijerinckiaceae bacterium]VVB43571.1 Porin [Beijerinckiaceae bacterium RH AL8]VVB43589.1 Porin [Beijerinckiaceae bacterium RH CH11]VVC53908.1 Porin [Beijerinckiaceae bacterium RH AL1]
MTTRTAIGGASLGLLLAFGASGVALAQQAEGPPTGSGIATRDTAKATSRNEGTAAAPPGLAPGVLDLKNGVSVLLNYTGEFAANPSGGLKQGNAFAGQLAVGADADLNRIAGITGGSVHFLLTDRQGRSLSGSDIGNDTSVQEIYGAGQTYRLTQLGYEQRLFNDRLDFEVGRLNGQGMTLTSPLYCNFQNNAACGSPTTAFKITNFTYYPTTSWGGHAKFWLDPDYRVFFHVGAYEVNPNRLLPNDHGFDWSTQGATGVNIPMELGYSTTAANDRLPRNYGIGMILDESKYSDPIYTNAGTLQAVTANGTPQTDFGRSAVFARFDQMIWRPDSSSLRGITVFGVGIVGTGGQQTQSFFAEGGALWTGIFPSRPYDTLGFDVTDQHYSGLGLFNLRTASAVAGINPAIFPSDQFMLELNYGIQLDPGLRVLPQLQYIVNPTQPAAPYLTRPIPNAFVLGFKFSADLLTLARLAKGPGSI